jgi:hypothetical protein
VTRDEIRKAIKKRTTVVDSWEAFHKHASRYTDSAWLFRGCASPEHYPVPGVGREDINGFYKRAHEQRLFREFKRTAVGMVRAPYASDWWWLALAQHHGLPTRLLDWSTSPLVGAFFAVAPDVEEDRVVYCVKLTQSIHEIQDGDADPFDVAQVKRFTPPAISPRILAQNAVFTVHPNPVSIFFHDSLRVMRIPAALAPKINRRLHKYGVNFQSLFPDLDGVGKQLAWQYRRRIGLGSVFMDPLKTA